MDKLTPEIAEIEERAERAKRNHRSVALTTDETLMLLAEIKRLSERKTPEAIAELIAQAKVGIDLEERARARVKDGDWWGDYIQFADHRTKTYRALAEAFLDLAERNCGGDCVSVPKATLERWDIDLMPKHDPPAITTVRAEITTLLEGGDV